MATKNDEPDVDDVMLELAKRCRSMSQEETAEFFEELSARASKQAEEIRDADDSDESQEDDDL